MSTPAPPSVTQVGDSTEYSTTDGTMGIPLTGPVPAGAALVLTGGSGSTPPITGALAAVSDDAGNTWDVLVNNQNQRQTAIAVAHITAPLAAGDRVYPVHTGGNVLTRWTVLRVLHTGAGWRFTTGPAGQASANAAAVSLPSFGSVGPYGGLAAACLTNAGTQALTALAWPQGSAVDAFGDSGGEAPQHRSFARAWLGSGAVGNFTGTLAASAAHSVSGVILNAAPIPVTITGPASLPAAQVGQPYLSPPVTWDGGVPPAVVTTGPLPPGLALAGDHLAGMPTDDGSFEVQFSVTDALGSTASITLGLHVAPAPPPGPPPHIPPWTGPAVRLPAEWTFWADTIIGGQPLGPVQPATFSFGRLLSGFGKGEVTLPAVSTALDQARLLKLWSWRLWALYGGQPVWCGVPTGIADAGDVTITLTLTELAGYLEKRVWEHEQPVTYTQTEQTIIARDIAAPLADVGVDIVTSPGPGVPRDRTYEFLESESRAELLVNLSQVGQAENQAAGPQFRTEYWMDAGRPRCRLRIAYPRVGQQGGLGLTVPGTATGFSTAWDADQLRTRTYAVGELPENAPEGARAPVYVENRPQPDLPVLEAADNYPGVSRTGTLKERARTAAAQYATPVLALSATGRVDSPPLPSYGPGDDVTIRVATPFLAGGIEATAQLTELTVNAADGTAEWAAATVLPPPKPRETLAGRLDRLTLLATAAFRQRGLAPTEET